MIDAKPAVLFDVIAWDDGTFTLSWRTISPYGGALNGFNNCFYTNVTELAEAIQECYNRYIFEGDQDASEETETESRSDR